MSATSTTILVIEDSGDDAELIRVAFRKAGFENTLKILWNPNEALDYLEGKGDFSDRIRFPFPALVMLDHKLPGDGWPVIEWVRRQTKLDWLPVVVFSGSDDPNHQQKAFDLGANAYHIKPQTFEDFTATIKRIGEFWLKGRQE